MTNPVGTGGGDGFDMGAFNRLFARSDMWLAIGLITIVMMMIIPMPTFVVDMGLTLSLTFAVIILMTVLFIKKALDLSSFPTVLLIATLLRLALNLGTTRLILSHGNEGTRRSERLSYGEAASTLS